MSPYEPDENDGWMISNDQAILVALYVEDDAVVSDEACAWIAPPDFGSIRLKRTAYIAPAGR
jgi:hypothetical protein